MLSGFRCGVVKGGNLEMAGSNIHPKQSKMPLRGASAPRSNFDQRALVDKKILRSCLTSLSMFKSILHLDAARTIDSSCSALEREVRLERRLFPCKLEKILASSAMTHPQFPMTVNCCVSSWTAALRSLCRMITG